MHHTDQARPIDLGRTLELARPRIAQPGKIVGVKCVTHFVQPAPAGASEHLEKLIRFDLVLKIGGEITPVGHDHRAHRKINAGGKTHRRHDHVELAGFRQRFHHAGPGCIAQSAMMISHSIAQQPGQLLSSSRFLCWCQS